MIEIPEGLTGKELLEFLVSNKAVLIKQKCAFPIKSEPVNFPYESEVKHTVTRTKSAGEPVSIGAGEANIKAIANAANFIDCQMDMLLPDCWKKSIKESGPDGKDRIYHLKNHCQNTDGIIGKITKIYSQEYAIKDLGIDMMGTTQCLVIESSVKEKLDQKCFEQYADKIISQHSIGLQYVKMDVAVNDPNYPAEFEIWNKYFMQVVNKDLATKCGYFWVVYEIKLMEVSAVLWGANELTPTIYEEEKSKPSKDTKDKKEPEKKATPTISEMISKAKINIHI
jgi:hypothetical protein